MSVIKMVRHEGNDPLAVIMEGIEKLRTQAGVKPNTLWVGQLLWDELGSEGRAAQEKLWDIKIKLSGG